MRACVTGAGGFIGGHLVGRLKAEEHWVRAVDVRSLEFGASAADEFVLADLAAEADPQLFRGCDRLYHLAADMGGMGYLAARDVDVLASNLAIDRNTFLAAVVAGVPRLLYASSACVYPEWRQAEEQSPPLTEGDAWPADPDTLYGLEKLLAERLLLGLAREGRIEARIARFHNVYGPLGAWRGGREKAPAAICRKVAEAAIAGRRRIEVWGDGRARRTFLHVDDCLDGILRLTESEVREPVNLGSDRDVSVDDLAGLVAQAAGVEVEVDHVPGPQGVRGRSCCNDMAKRLLGWQPMVSLEEGLRRTYAWVAAQVAAARAEAVP